MAEFPDRVNDLCGNSAGKKSRVRSYNRLMKRLYEPAAYEVDVGSWWEATQKAPVWPGLDRDIITHTVIIGAGYTGLACALELDERFDTQDVVLLDARQPGWGASGRNGGFCCMGGSKLSYQAHINRFGEAETLNYFNEQIASVESVRENLHRYEIDADIHSDGETCLAHTIIEAEKLMQEKTNLKSRLGIDTEFLHKADLAASGLNSPQFHGALTNPVGFAINPMKYVSGLANQVEARGISAFGNTPAFDIEQIGTRWRVATPGGIVTAKNLVIATNGYSSEDLPPWLAGRLLPTLTNIIVTRPLTAAELAAQGWTSHQMCYDTRNALHYFHLLPKAEHEEGPRMLFGMRSGTSSTKGSMDAMRQRIRLDFNRMFPAWQSVETPFFWSGLVCLTRDLTSFTGPFPGMNNAYASLAYHGNGVAMASHCGRLLAGMIAGEIGPEDIPAAMRQPPRKFPFPSLRRTYLAAAYKWYEWQDG